MSDKVRFLVELEQLVNRCSMESVAGDTQDFVVADLLTTVLVAFGKAVVERDRLKGYGEPSDERLAIVKARLATSPWQLERADVEWLVHEVERLNGQHMEAAINAAIVTHREKSGVKW